MVPGRPDSFVRSWLPHLTPPLPFEEWAAARRAALIAASRPTTVAATALTEEGSPDSEGEPEPDPGLRKRPLDIDLPPWLKGRYGTAVGRAVHGVMQTIDLATGAGLEDGTRRPVRSRGGRRPRRTRSACSQPRLSPRNR